MMGIKIDKGIPLPRKGSCGEFSLMHVGDSVFIPNKKSGDVHGKFKHLIRKGRKFSARNCEVDGVAGCRLWRVK